MLLYCHTITPRLQYVVHFLECYYGVALNSTSDAAAYAAAPDAVRINYSAQPLAANEILVVPQGLLFEQGLKTIPVDCFDCNGHTAFFKTGGALPFDLFAAVFYLLSRYEEYLPHPKDSYGRFAHSASVAYQQNFLKIPLVNIWLEGFRTLLIEKDASFTIHHSQFIFQPTYDIDLAWSYRAKGTGRTAGGLLKAAAQGRWHAVRDRVNVLRGTQQDPFDAYGWMEALHRRHGLKPMYFFLVAQQRGQFDKNPSPRNGLFQTLMRRIAAQNSVGLHPSWQSGDDLQLLQTEKTFLEKVTQQQITTSRQHYIRFTLPQTYRRLIDAGITHDYSMGYGSTNGFRASVATPFYWYDLEREEETGLLLHPFCFMDANSYYEQGQTAEETGHELQHYYRAVKSVNGHLCTIWHNHFLGTDPAFRGWREVYEDFVKQV